MILEIPRPPAKTPKHKIAALFGVSRVTLRAAELDGRFERTARVFRLTVRSVGTYNAPRATPPRLRCTWCLKPLTKRQVALDRTYCGTVCANRAKWYQRRQAHKRPQETR